MAKVIFGMTISLDGFVQDKDGSVSLLYSDFAETRDSEPLQQAMRDTGAVVMGRHSYDMANGDYTGYEFQTPIFVVTHNPPATTAKGENDKLSFTFVTDGVESAIAKAKAAAGEKDVTVVGGADIGQQLFKAKLVDELHVDIVPVLLGAGLRLFENLDGSVIELEQLSVVELPKRTCFKYRVAK